MNASNTCEDLGLASRAGTVLADKLQSLMASVLGEHDITLADIDNYKNLCFKVENVLLVEKLGRKQGHVGTVYPTTTHLIFKVPQDKEGHSNLEIWIPNNHIGSVERGSLSVTGCPLTLKCKTFRTAYFLIPRDKECQMLFETLLLMSQPLSINNLCAFDFVAPSSWGLSQEDGWDVDQCIIADYQRMGLPNDSWAQNQFNKDYQYCDTYPQSLFLPCAAPKQVLIGSSKFRSRGRLPTLSYLHKDNGTSLCRCSQPLVGFSARCLEDEQLMQYIRKANNNTNAYLYIVDTRPKVNAMVNKAAGKGFEDEKYYTNMRFHFCNIENIHVMRNSLAKMTETLGGSLAISQFMSGLENSGWLKHIRCVLECASFIKDAMLRGHSCVVHCSDGWDRTAQTVALAQVFIDPYYRTLQGLKVLIEREWLHFGHKFSDRCGHTSSAASVTEKEKVAGQNSSSPISKEVSPIFLQFVECLWHLGRMHPQVFEFNERLLLELHDHVHACQFGTFLGNCDKDRKDLRLDTKTYSFWAYMDKNVHRFLNPIYDKGANQGPLNSDLRPQRFSTWLGMYNRFDDGFLPRENLVQSTSVAKEHSHVLVQYKNRLKERLDICKISPTRGDTLCASVCKVDNLMDSGHSSLENRSQDKCGQHPSQSDCESGFEDSCNLGDQRSDTRPLDSMSVSVLSMSMDASVLDDDPCAVQVRWQNCRANHKCTKCDKLMHSYEYKGHCNRCGLLFCENCLKVREGIAPIQCSGCVSCLNKILD